MEEKGHVHLHYEILPCSHERVNLGGLGFVYATAFIRLTFFLLPDL